MSSDENPVTSLIVHAYDWTIKDKFDENDHVHIHCWALDRESNPYLLRITNFPAFCHIELPQFIHNRHYNWQPAAINTFMNLLSGRLGEDAPIRHTFKMAKKIYYYRGNRKYPMIQVCFKNLKAMQHCTYLLENPIKTEDWGFIKCTVWENDISIVRKLLTVRNTKFSQWFHIDGRLVPSDIRISKLTNEYLVDWDTMEPISNEDSKSWSSYPGILSFDIECYSSNHRAMPNKYDAQHTAYMLSAIYQRYGYPQTRKRYGILIGECHDIPTERLANCQIIKVNDEYELVEAFSRIIDETDPEVLIGYNILSFDYPYLDHRIKRRLKSWPVMGRIIGQKSEMNSKTWQSGAYGHQSINILQMEGRISIDLLPIIRRDHGRLDKYTLDHVCRHFIGKSKHDIKPVEMFEIYEDMRTSLNELNTIPLEDLEKKAAAEAKYQAAIANTTRVMEYCIQDSELVIELMEKLNTWVGLIELSNIVGITMVEIFTRGQQVRCMSQLYDKTAREGFILDRRDTPTYKFTGGYVYEPIPGLYENIMCLDFASLYPSIIQAFNICYTTLVPPELNDTIPDEDCYVIEFDQDEVDGAIAEEENSDDEEELKEIAEKSKKKVNTVKRHYKFKYYKHIDGIIPGLVKELVAQRRAVVAQMKVVKEPILKAVLNTRQLALKVSANSWFGFLGVQRGGKMALMEGAMSITAKGRELINHVKDNLEKKYQGKMVAGDTDSCMIDLHITDRTKCQYWGERLAQDINGVKKGDPLPGTKNPKVEVHMEDIPGWFLAPLKMEFEKAMRLLCFKKKKYAALLIDSEGDFKRIPDRNANGDVIGYSDKFQILKRGIATARRDNCKFIYTTYDKILEMILTKQPYLQAINFLLDSVQKLLTQGVSYEDLIIIRSLGANYKSNNYFMKLFSDNLVKAGKIVNPGDRLDFVIVNDSNATLLGHKMRLTEQYVEKLNSNTPESIDYMYYIEKLMMNPINQLFEVGYQDIISKLSNISFRPTNRHKPTHLDKPMKIIHRMLAHNFDIESFRKIVINNVTKLNDTNISAVKPLRLNIIDTQPVNPQSLNSQSLSTNFSINLPTIPSIKTPQLTPIKTPQSTPQSTPIKLINNPILHIQEQ